MEVLNQLITKALNSELMLIFPKKLSIPHSGEFGISAAFTQLSPTFGPVLEKPSNEPGELLLVSETNLMMNELWLVAGIFSASQVRRGTVVAESEERSQIHR